MAVMPSIQRFRLVKCKILVNKEYVVITVPKKSHCRDRSLVFAYGRCSLTGGVRLRRFDCTDNFATTFFFFQPLFFSTTLL